MYKLIKSHFHKNGKIIKQIATDQEALSYFDEKYPSEEYDITIGQYLFYMGIFNKEFFDDDTFERINLSIKAIKGGMKHLAIDFCKRKEYNSFKHGFGIMSALRNMKFHSLDRKHVIMNIDLSNTVTYFVKENHKIKSTTALDSVRIIE